MKETFLNPPTLDSSTGKKITEGFWAETLVNVDAIDQMNDSGGIKAVQGEFNQIYQDAYSKDPKKMEMALMMGFGIPLASNPIIVANAKTPPPPATAAAAEAAKKDADKAKAAAEKAADKAALAGNPCKGPIAAAAKDTQAIAKAAEEEAKKHEMTDNIQTAVAKICKVKNGGVSATAAALMTPPGGSPAAAPPAGAAPGAAGAQPGAPPGAAPPGAAPPAPGTPPGAPPGAPPAAGGCTWSAPVQDTDGGAPQCPPGFVGKAGAGRCHESDLESAKAKCDKDPLCAFIVKDAVGWEPRNSGGYKVVGNQPDRIMWTCTRGAGGAAAGGVGGPQATPPSVEASTPGQAPPGNSSVGGTRSGSGAAAVPPPPTKGIKIIRASYGPNCNPELHGNRTDLFKGLADGKDSLDYQYNFQTTGGDPAPGCGKILDVVYNCNGDKKNKAFTAPAEAGYNAKVKLTC